MDETMETTGHKPDTEDQGEAPVRLIDPRERLTHKSGASEYYYRRMPATVRNQIMQKCTSRGEINWGKFQLKALEWSLTGWKNVRDLDGNDVAFERRLVAAIPGDDAIALQDLMGANIEADEARLGNS